MEGVKEAIGRVQMYALSFWISQALYTITELRVPDILDQHGPLTAREIASHIEGPINETNLFRTLRTLVSHGFFGVQNDESATVEEAGEGKEGATVKESSKFCLTIRSAILAASHPMSMRTMVLAEAGPAHYLSWSKYNDVVRTGNKGPELQFGMEYWEYCRQNPTHADNFHQWMAANTRVAGHAVLGMLNAQLDGLSELCDVGGGLGKMLTILMQEKKHLKGVVFDQPEVIAQLESDLNTHIPLELQDRFTIAKGGFFEAETVPSCQAYFMKSVLHDWGDEDCRKILKNLHSQAPEGARLFNCDFIIPERITSPEPSLMCDLHMMCMLNARERSVEDFKSLFAECGWKFVQVHRAAGFPMGVVEAVKN